MDSNVRKPTGESRDIVLHDVATGAMETLSKHPARSDIPGYLLVWHDWRHNPRNSTPPDGRKMVNADIYLDDLATDKETRLTCGPALELDPHVDGRRVFFTAGESGVSHAIFLVDLDASDGT